MFSNLKTVSLGAEAIFERLQRLDSGGVTEGTENSAFRAGGEADVIRYRISMPELKGKAPAFICFRYALKVPKGGATHVSIVNRNVSDGAIWEIQPEDCEGTFTLTTVLRPPLDEVVVYINLSGAQEGSFRLESLTARQLEHRHPLRAAFVIDPWIEFNMPERKADYIWWFGNLEKTLRQSGLAIESHYVFGDHLESFWPRYRPNKETGYSTIIAQELLALYGEHQAGMIDQRQSLNDPDKDGKRAAFAKMLKSAIPFEPDIVFAMSDMQLLRDVFPTAAVLFRDAIYCRPPFPDELTSLDPNGMYSSASFTEMVNDSRAAGAPAEFLKQFFPPEEKILDLLKSNGLEEGKFVLLPLQSSKYIAFFNEASFKGPIDIILTTLKRFPDMPVLLTQHPEYPEIPLEALKLLCKEHPNLRYIEALEAFGNPSARVLPFVGRVAGISTGVLYQAMLLGKPVNLLGRHALKTLDVSDGRESGRIGHALLQRVFASYRYLHDWRWLIARIAALKLWRHGDLPSSALAIDLPGSVLNTLVKHARPMDL